MTTLHNTALHYKLKLALIVLLFSFMIEKSFATGESCSVPYTVVPDENFSNQNFFINNADKTVWFSFVANYNTTDIYTCENAAVVGFSHAMQIDFYTGTCGALSIVQSQLFDDSPQGERSIIASNLNLGQTYFVKITAKNSNSNLLMAFINFKTTSPIAY